MHSKESLCLHLNISLFSYHYEELHAFLSSINVKPKILATSDSRVRKDRQPISNISLLNYTYEHTTTEVSTRSACIYKNYLTYKTCKNLLIHKSKQLESIFNEIANKNGKKTIVCCIYKNPTLSNQEFLENHMFPLLEKFHFNGNR